MTVLPNHPLIRIYWHAPAPIFAAQVHMPGVISYPIQDIAYDNVTTGAYTDLAADMFFTLGSAAGLDDYGRGRLRAAPTSTLLKVGRSSQGYEDGQLNVVNDAYISVYEDYRVHAKIPTIVNFVEYKDTDIPVGDLTEEPPPVCNMGADFAGSIDPDTGTLTVFFEGSNSMPVADGATITGYAWDADGGTFVNGTSATDDDVYIEFDPGVYWVALTVTDSNGKTNSGRRMVLADDSDASLCVSGMQVQNITRTQQGSVARLRVLQDLPRANYPDGAKILIWEDSSGLDGVSRDHMLFSGWHQTDQASARALETHLQRETQLTCVDVLGRLDSLPGFPQRVEVPTAEDLAADGVTWGYMPAANMDKFLCYLLHWHSTADGVADFYPSGTWDAYPFVLFDSGGATLYEQLQRQANRIVPDHNFTCDRFGAMRVVVDPMLQNLADRTATVQQNVTEQTWQSIDFGYQRPPRVHTLRGSALSVQTEWVIEGDDKALLTPFFSIAPGTAPGQGGREATIGERLAQSQADLNDCIGHHYARMNARYGPISADLNINTDPWGFDPAAHTWVQFIISDSAAPQRGLDFDTIRCLCKEVSMDYTYSEEAMQVRGRVVLERETVGLPALTEEFDETLPVGTQPSPAPLPYVPDFGLLPGQELVAGIGDDGYVYRTSDFQTASGSGGPTWDRVDLSITGPIFSWVVDPFSPGYIDGSGTIDGWVVNETDIYYVEDLFGTPSATSVHTFATAVDADEGHWRTIQASFGEYFSEGSNPWLLCISYYGATSGHTGTYALRSLDGGTTWLGETTVSTAFDVGPVQVNTPIGVYTSPKTPGLAYTAAYLETASPALADGFVSSDWGETWTAISGAPADDPIEQLPRWRIWDDVAGAYESGSLLSANGYVEAAASASGNGGFQNVDRHLICGAPADAVRVEVSGRWTTEWGRTGSPGFQMQVQPLITGSGLTQVEDLDHTIAPSPGGFTWEDFAITWEFTLSPANDWPNNRDVILSSSTLFGARLRTRSQVATGTGESGFAYSTGSLRVTEIELDDGTIYTPPIIGAGWLQPENGFAGAIHIPWPDNDDEGIAYYGHLNRFNTIAYKLMQSIAGTQTDISPTDTGVSYGVNHYGFSVRSYDSDRNYMAVGGIGNDAGTDKVGLWVSSNAGAAWANILSPVAATEALYGLQIAFSGTDPDVLFAWGGYSNASNIAAIYYSDDFGSTLDSREGNINSLGTVAFVGIAGGPTA